MYAFLFLWNPNGHAGYEPPTNPNPNGVRILKPVWNIGRSLILHVNWPDSEPFSYYSVIDLLPGPGPSRGARVSGGVTLSQYPKAHLHEKFPWDRAVNSRDSIMSHIFGYIELDDVSYIVHMICHYTVLLSMKSVNKQQGSDQNLIKEMLCWHGPGDRGIMRCDGIAPLAQGLWTWWRQASQTPLGGLKLESLDNGFRICIEGHRECNFTFLCDLCGARIYWLSIKSLLIVRFTKFKKWLNLQNSSCYNIFILKPFGQFHFGIKSRKN